MPGPPPFTARPTGANKPVIVLVIAGVLGLAYWSIVSGQGARNQQRAQVKTHEPITVASQPLILAEPPAQPTPPPKPLETTTWQPRPNAPAPQVLNIPPAKERQRQAQPPPPPPPQQQRKALVVVQIDAQPDALSDQNPFDLQTSLYDQTTPYTVMIGDSLPITILTPVYSDVPGQITAVVSRDVYDSVTQTYKIIPQGTKVIGVYDHEVNVGQKRVLMAWNVLNFPNGTQKYLAQQQGSDQQGMAGVADLVNRHFWEVFGTAIALSMVSTGAEIAQQQNYNTNNPYGSPSSLASQQLGLQLGRTSNQILQQGLNRPPTIEIRPGKEATVMLKQNLVFPSPYPFHQGGSHVREEARVTGGSHRSVAAGTRPPDDPRRAGRGDPPLPRSAQGAVQAGYRPEESDDLPSPAGFVQEPRVSGR